MKKKIKIKGSFYSYINKIIGLSLCKIESLCIGIVDLVMIIG